MRKTIPSIKLLLYRICVVMVVFSVVSPSQAATVYINDQLRVGIRPEPDNEAVPLAVVSTGEEMELLDRESGYAMVRTKAGVEGWVKEIYTTTKLPAVVQLQALTQRTGGSVKKIKDLAEQVGVMQSANEVLSSELEQTRAEKTKIQMQLLAARNGQSSNHWIYWLASMLIFTVGSFFVGVFWYRKQAMKRLGGLRIYF